MKNILLSISVLLCIPVSAAVGEPALELKGYVSAWTQDCSGSACKLPVPGERNRPVTLRLALPSSPGEAAAAHYALKLGLAGGGELEADINFYAVCPYGGQENCAGRYFQSQVAIAGDGAAFCASALNLSDFSPFPVVMCAGSSGGARRGVTLHREPL